VHFKNDPKGALALYDQAMELLLEVQRREPGHSEIAAALTFASVGRADVHNRLERFADALKDWHRAVLYETRPQRDRWRSFRAYTLARLGEHRKAADEADDLLNRPSLSADDRFTLACTYAAVSGSGTGSEKFAARALDVLGKLHATGYFKTAELLNELRS